MAKQIAVQPKTPSRPVAPPKRATTVKRVSLSRLTRVADLAYCPEVVERAIEVIGDRDDALRWLGTPVRSLNYATPISLFGTAKGRESVLQVLGRLEHGVM